MMTPQRIWLTNPNTVLVGGMATLSLCPISSEMEQAGWIEVKPKELPYINGELLIPDEAISEAMKGYGDILKAQLANAKQETDRIKALMESSS